MGKLDKEKLPKHVAIIMDGNRRWAKQRGLPAVAGHKVSVDTRVEELIEAAGELKIPYVTFWAWSSENWSRPGDEVKGIMKLFRWALKNKAKKMIERGARLRVIGDWQAFDDDIREGIEQMIEASINNSKVNVTFALNYGGRDEIVRGINKILKDNDHGPMDISSKNFSTYLDTVDLPDPDLIIRPGGEQRLSGFMLWQAEYAELYFPDVLMPDFDKSEFVKALEEFQKRNRRFGGS